MATLDSSAGAFLCAAILASYGSGILVVQAFSYYRSFPNDPRPLRWMVGLLVFMDLFHSSISLYTPYLWIVKAYGDPSVLETTPWSFNVELGITGAVASIVQLYFAHRIYLLRGRKVVWPVIVAILSTSQFAMAFAVLGEAFILRRFDRFRSFTGGVTAWLSLAVLTDILITSLLVHSVRKATRSDFQNTNSIIDSLLRNIVATNGLTTTVALINTIVFALHPDQGWFAIPNLLLAKLYLNSLLESLNSRARLSERLQASKNEAVKVRLGAHGRLSMDSYSMSPQRSVHVEVDQSIAVDDPLDYPQPLPKVRTGAGRVSPSRVPVPVRDW